MPDSKNPLQKQLDHQKFLHAIEYVRKESQGIKKLSTTELSRTNQFLSGKPDDPWRFEAVEIQIPGGPKHLMNVISNPMSLARDLIGNALQMSGNGKGSEAAEYLYSELVLAHLFQIANRRTAVAAALWILLISGYDCDAEELLEIPVGDLRKPEELKSLREKMHAILKKVI